MASDSITQVGKYIKNSGKNADLALKRYRKSMPDRQRARDTVSSVYPFRMTIESDGTQAVSLDINFNKPPPDECSSNCIATACEGFNITGGHSLTMANPYVAGSVSVFSNGAALSETQWYEENESAGRVYVQAQSSNEVIVVCYAYIIC